MYIHISVEKALNELLELGIVAFGQSWTHDLYFLNPSHSPVCVSFVTVDDPPNHFQMESAGGLKRRLLPETEGEFDL